jgi:hypothetical protein
MMRRSGETTVGDLDESAARDDLDRMVLRILPKVAGKPLTDAR